MNNIFKYIELAIGVGESVTAFVALIAAKQKLTGAQVAAAAGPAIAAIETAFSVTIPPALITDVSATAADAINQYVF